MLLGCGRVDYELLPPKQHVVHSFVVIEHKYTSLEMIESEFRLMAIVVRQNFTTTTNDHGFAILLISSAQAKAQSPHIWLTQRGEGGIQALIA
jgi:hypothetical protein